VGQGDAEMCVRNAAEQAFMCADIALSDCSQAGWGHAQASMQLELSSMGNQG